jgi:5-methyltetrahydrofolate--homocysteine methyltransferase
MIIIGEKINATRKKIAAAVEARDSDYILQVGREQVEAGADYLDVNGGDPAKEVENMSWLVELLQKEFQIPLCIDSANPEAIKSGLELAKTGKSMVNSISAEKERLESMLPVLSEYTCNVVALCMSDEGPPKGVDDRIATAENLIEKLCGAGKKIDEIYVDFCVFPVSADQDAPHAMCLAIQKLREMHPEIHFCAGMSNVSYGLPERRLINQAFTAQLIGFGLDAIICDPNAPGMLGTIYASEALAGRDEFCMNYLTAHREGKLKS